MHYRDLNDAAKVNARYNVRTHRAFAEAIVPAILDVVSEVKDKLKADEKYGKFWAVYRTDWGIGWGEICFEHIFLDDSITVTVAAEANLKTSRALYALDVNGKTFEELTSPEWLQMLQDFKALTTEIWEAQVWDDYQWEAFFNSHNYEFDEGGKLC